MNNVLPLKAAQRDAIANLKCFLGLGDADDAISMVSFIVAVRRQFIRLVSAPFTSRLVGLRLLTSACNAWHRSRTQILWRVGKNSGRILSRLWTKFHEIFRRCKGPLVLFRALARLFRLRRCRRPLLVTNAFARLCTSCFVPKT